MQIDKVGLSAKNIDESVKFYKILGFEFEEYASSDQHVETTNEKGAKLMLDSEKLLVELNGESTRPGNKSAFAMLFKSTEELNSTAKKLKETGYKFKKEPWDAFWGQRYAVSIDPNEYLVDLYAYL